jgi:hypothetical protein
MKKKTVEKYFKNISSSSRISRKRLISRLADILNYDIKYMLISKKFSCLAVGPHPFKISLEYTNFLKKIMFLILSSWPKIALNASFESV